MNTWTEGLYLKPFDAEAAKRLITLAVRMGANISHIRKIEYDQNRYNGDVLVIQNNKLSSKEPDDRCTVPLTEAEFTTMLFEHKCIPITDKDRRIAEALAHGLRPGMTVDHPIAQKQAPGRSAWTLGSTDQWYIHANGDVHDVSRTAHAFTWIVYGKEWAKAIAEEPLKPGDWVQYKTSKGGQWKNSYCVSEVTSLKVFLWYQGDPKGDSNNLENMERSTLPHEPLSEPVSASALKPGDWVEHHDGNWPTAYCIHSIDGNKAYLWHNGKRGADWTLSFLRPSTKRHNDTSEPPVEAMVTALQQGDYLEPFSQAAAARIIGAALGANIGVISHRKQRYEQNRDFLGSSLIYLYGELQEGSGLRIRALTEAQFLYVISGTRDLTTIGVGDEVERYQGGQHGGIMEGQRAVVTKIEYGDSCELNGKSRGHSLTNLRIVRKTHDITATTVFEPGEEVEVLVDTPDNAHFQAGEKTFVSHVEGDKVYLFLLAHHHYAEVHPKAVAKADNYARPPNLRKTGVKSDINEVWLDALRDRAEANGFEERAYIRSVNRADHHLVDINSWTYEHGMLRVNLPDNCSPVIYSRITDTWATILRPPDTYYVGDVAEFTEEDNPGDGSYDNDACIGQTFVVSRNNGGQCVVWGTVDGETFEASSDHLRLITPTTGATPVSGNKPTTVHHEQVSEAAYTGRKPGGQDQAIGLRRTIHAPETPREAPQHARGYRRGRA